MMSSSSPVPLGRHLLDRRGFLAHMATGVGGIANGTQRRLTDVHGHVIRDVLT